MPEKLLLDGKKAVVTGAANGIGEAIAKAYLREGAKVLAVDLPGKALAERYAGHERAFLFERDVTLIDAPAAIIGAAASRLGGIDILVNNAGISLGAGIEETSDDLWERTMAVNVTAMFKITRAAIPYLKSSKAGRIINLGSIMSEMAGPGLFAYGTSKHAVAGMTKAMAVDLGQHGVTANYLQPGAIVTALSAPFFEDAAFRRYWEGKAPVGRLGQPEDVAAAAVFLATDAAQFVSGAGVKVDGGAIVKF